MKKFLLRAIYVFLREVVRGMFGVYYSKTQADNLHYLNMEGPAILLSNHPNGMIDPLDTALRSKRMVHFLAKAELFNPPILNWFFNTFFCIPVERSDFSNGKHIDNAKSFDRCNQFLHEGGALYVAPEGTSLLVRRLLDFKTGAARIALRAEAGMDFKLGIQIIPTGITYVDQGEFRSTQYICTGKPIMIGNFKEAYLNDPKEAVIKLTELLETRMADLVIVLDNDDQIPLLETLMLLLYSDIKSRPREFFITGKALAKQLNELDKAQAEKIEELKKQVSEINDISKKQNTRVEDIICLINPWNAIQWIIHSVILIAGLPIFLYGFINHFLPNFIPWIIEKLARLHIIYRATIKMLLGLISYLVCYLLQIILVWKLSLNPYILILYVISLIASGVAFYPYLKAVNRLLCQFRGLFMSKYEKNDLENKILTLKYLINN